MQISSASLLAAQQARVQTPTQPPRAPQAAEPAGFEPLFLASKAETPAPNAAGVQPQQAVPFARPGSQVDIKV